jgi:hypothetical protein
MEKTRAHNRLSRPLVVTFALASEAVTTIEPMVHLHGQIRIALASSVDDTTMEDRSCIAPAD